MAVRSIAVQRASPGGYDKGIVCGPRCRSPSRFVCVYQPRYWTTRKNRNRSRGHRYSLTPDLDTSRSHPVSVLTPWLTPCALRITHLVDHQRGAVRRDTSICDIQGGAKKRGHPQHPVSRQIFWKFHDRIAWKLVNFCNIICWTLYV